MKVIVTTDEYTIYQKRNERYAVRDSSKAWVNGNAKVAILVEHKLIDVPVPKEPEPEAAVEEVAEAEGATAEEAVAEAGGEEEAVAEAPVEEAAEEAAEDEPPRWQYMAVQKRVCFFYEATSASMRSAKGSSSPTKGAAASGSANADGGDAALGRLQPLPLQSLFQCVWMSDNDALWYRDLRDHKTDAPHAAGGGAAGFNGFTGGGGGSLAVGGYFPSSGGGGVVSARAGRTTEVADSIGRGWRLREWWVGKCDGATCADPLRRTLAFRLDQ